MNYSAGFTLYSMRSKLLPESKSSTTVVLSGSLADCSAVLDVKNKSKSSTKVYEKAVFRIRIQLGLWVRIKTSQKGFKTKEKY
jgi:hypothetical protein